MTPGGYGHKALCKPFKIIIVAWLRYAAEIGSNSSPLLFFSTSNYYKPLSCWNKEKYIIRLTTDGYTSQHEPMGTLICKNAIVTVNCHST